MELDKREMRLCRRIASEKSRWAPQFREDIQQEAVLAALRALPQYRPELGGRLTFLWRCVRSHLDRVIPKMQAPANMGDREPERLFRSAKAARQFEQEHGRPPDRAELAELLGFADELDMIFAQQAQNAVAIPEDNDGD